MKNPLKGNSLNKYIILVACPAVMQKKILFDLLHILYALMSYEYVYCIYYYLKLFACLF